MAIGKYMSAGQQFAHIENNTYDRYFTKLYDGAAIGAMSLLTNGYYTPLIVSKTPEGAACHCTDLSWSGFSRDFVLGSGVREISIDGTIYYYMNEWGLLAEYSGEYDIDGRNKSSETIIRELLGLQSLDSRTIIVKWKRPTDGKILTDTFDVTVSSGGGIDHEYTGPQE